MFVSNVSGVYKKYSFSLNIMEQIFEIRSCIEILPNDIKIYTIDQYMFYR